MDNLLVISFLSINDSEPIDQTMFVLTIIPVGSFKFLCCSLYEFSGSRIVFKRASKKSKELFLQFLLRHAICQALYIFLFPDLTEEYSHLLMFWLSFFPGEMALFRENHCDRKNNQLSSRSEQHFVFKVLSICCSFHHQNYRYLLPGRWNIG